MIEVHSFNEDWDSILIYLSVTHTPFIFFPLPHNEKVRRQGKVRVEKIE